MNKVFPDFMLSEQVFLYEKNPGMYAGLKKDILETIKSENMADYYLTICQQFQWPVDESMRDEMLRENAIKLEKLDLDIETAKTDLGESEIREANLQRAHHLCKTSSKENAIAAYKETLTKTISLGQKIEIIMILIRLGFFYLDFKLLTENIAAAKVLIDEGGDWDKRNHLKVYEGLFKLYTRDFNTTSDLFIGTLSTFSTLDIVTLPNFVAYTAISSLLTSDRINLNKKIIEAPEFYALSHDMGEGKTVFGCNYYASKFGANAVITDLINSFYTFQYRDFFTSLAKLDLILSHDKYMSRHNKVYVRRLRIKAYKQLLQSYSSVTIAFMANAFGVSQEFIDAELSELIASDKLHCKIDKVSGVIVNNQDDLVSKQYHQIIKHGDILQDQIGKLCRVVNA